MLSITSSSSSEMSFKFFLAVEALEGVDLEEDFVVFDLAEALELGGSFCVVGFFMGLVLCSMLEGAVSCGQKQKSRKKFLKPQVKPTCRGFVIIMRRLSPRLPRAPS